jgi:hypothetical protein
LKPGGCPKRSRTAGNADIVAPDDENVRLGVRGKGTQRGEHSEYSEQQSGAKTAMAARKKVQ